jgi:hypothetical protein
VPSGTGEIEIHRKLCQRRFELALHISPEAWGWVTSVFFLSYSAFEIPTGALGDRIGPRRVLTRIVAWWSAFTTLTGTVSNYAVLLVVRFCFGAGEAGAYPNASAVIGRWIPVPKRARTWGIVAMAGQVGAALSPLLVVPIQVRYGWRASFFVFGLVGVAWSLAWYAWFRDSPREKAGVTEAELHEIGTGPGLLHHGMPWATALRLSALWRIAAIAACYFYTQGFFQSWLQTYLVKGRGFTEGALVLSSLSYVVGATANVAGGSATEPPRAVPRRRPQERRRDLWLHEHRGQCRGGAVRRGLWVHGGLFRQLQHAVRPDGGIALAGGGAVAASRRDTRTVSRRASRRISCRLHRRGEPVAEIVPDRQSTDERYRVTAQALAIRRRARRKSLADY